MSRITTDMVRVFNQRLVALGSPWRIVESEYDGAGYSQQTFAQTVNPTLAPDLIDNLRYTNIDGLEQTVILRVNRTKKLTHSVGVKNSFKIGAEVKVTINVLLAKVESTVSLEYARDETTTDTTEETVSFEFEQPVRVAPRTVVTMQTIIQLQTVTNLPFELHVKLRDGSFGVIPKDTVPLYRYLDETRDEHFYTRHPSTPDGFVSEGVACHVSTSQGPSMVPLHRYVLDNGNYHFYTIHPIILTSPWIHEGIEGYVYPGPTPGTVPLYRYYSEDNHLGDNHFYTTNFDELGSGRNGWLLERVEAYVVPPVLNNPTLLRSVRELFPNDNDRMFIIPGRYSGQSTNRNIDILLRSEPITDLASVGGKDPLERTPDHELATVPILSEKEALKVAPGVPVDLT